MTVEGAGYDAVIVISYGGPEGPDDVLPFLENATRGRGVPRDRLLDVAEHYHHFGGVSPINAQNRALAAALEAELRDNGPALPVFLGNRNWHPFLEDVLREMRDRGIRRALGLVTSAYGSYSGCRQYQEDIARARTAIGTDAPHVDKLRTFHNHPGFIEANVARLRGALDCIDLADRLATHVVFSAHSIPLSMARRCAYEAQLHEASALVARAVGVQNWTVAFQSRSGPPNVPWLEPDIADVLTDLSRSGVRDVVVAPIGFVSDHMEVMYDLDHEAREVARRLGLGFIRAGSAGTHPAFVRGLRALILERCAPEAPRLALGRQGLSPDACPPMCCHDGTHSSEVYRGAQVRT